MRDVITFGSATWDIFIRDEEILSDQDKKSPTGKRIYLPLGSKIEIDELRFSIGGGGTNALATFLSRGFKAAYCGSVGDDPIGEEIIADLKARGADVSLISKIKNKSSNLSLVLSVPGKDRTILAYRGASEELLVKDLLGKKTLAPYFYIAPLSGKLAESFAYIVDFAFENKIRVAVNLGQDQLKIPLNKLKKILSKTEILILNQEESSILTGIPYSKERDIFKEVSSFYSGIFVMTKGSRGVSVFDGQRRYEAGIIKSKIVDRTGAGDSFGSGFVSAIMDGQDVKTAIQFATANATSCLKEWGAKNGLIKKGEGYRKVKVDVK